MCVCVCVCADVCAGVVGWCVCLGRNQKRTYCHWGVFLYYSPTYFLFHICVCVCVCVCVCTNVHIYAVARRPKEDVRSPRVTSGCEPPDIGVGKWTEVFCKISKCSEQSGHLSSPPPIYYLFVYLLKHCLPLNLKSISLARVTGQWARIPLLWYRNMAYFLCWLLVLKLLLQTDLLLGVITTFFSFSRNTLAFELCLFPPNLHSSDSFLCLLAHFISVGAAQQLTVLWWNSTPTEHKTEGHPSTLDYRHHLSLRKPGLYLLTQPLTAAWPWEPARLWWAMLSRFITKMLFIST